MQGQAKAKDGVYTRQRLLAQPALEAWSESSRRALHIDDASQGGHRGRMRGGGLPGREPGGPQRQAFIGNRPENGCGMVDCIPQHAVSERRSMLVQGPVIPKPMADGIDRSDGAAAIAYPSVNQCRGRREAGAAARNYRPFQYLNRSLHFSAPFLLNARPRKGAWRRRMAVLDRAGWR